MLLLLSTWHEIVGNGDIARGVEGITFDAVAALVPGVHQHLLSHLFSRSCSHDDSAWVSLKSSGICWDLLSHEGSALHFSIALSAVLCPEVNVTVEHELSAKGQTILEQHEHMLVAAADTRHDLLADVYGMRAEVDHFVLPLNLRGSHWICLFIKDMRSSKDPRYFAIDSLSTETQTVACRDGDSWKTRVNRDMRLLARYLPQLDRLYGRSNGGASENVHLALLPDARQQNSSDCGPAALFNMYNAIGILAAGSDDGAMFDGEGFRWELLRGLRSRLLLGTERAEKLRLQLHADITAIRERRASRTNDSDSESKLSSLSSDEDSDSQGEDKGEGRDKELGSNDEDSSSESNSKGAGQKRKRGTEVKPRTLRVNNSLSGSRLKPGETAEGREIRLAKRREYDRNWRAKREAACVHQSQSSTSQPRVSNTLGGGHKKPGETTEERETRLAKQREYNRKRRARRSEVQRKDDLEKVAENARKRRANEKQERREARLEMNNTTARAWRAAQRAKQTVEEHSAANKKS